MGDSYRLKLQPLPLPQGSSDACPSLSCPSSVTPCASPTVHPTDAKHPREAGTGQSTPIPDPERRAHGVKHQGSCLLTGLEATTTGDRSVPCHEHCWACRALPAPAHVGPAPAAKPCRVGRGQPLAVGSRAAPGRVRGQVLRFLCATASAQP